MESPFLEVFKRCMDVALGKWFTDGLSTAGLKVELADLSLFQPE